MKINIFEKLRWRIEKGEIISPFLFLGKNIEILNSEIRRHAEDLLKFYDIPQTSLLVLEDTGEAIKISGIKEFVKPAELGTPYKIQIFLLENISRMTLQSFNSCLKFFEEPWVQNIIFLTNVSESGIIDTILSRVQIISVWEDKSEQKNSFYFSLLDNYLKESWKEIFSYFFRNKLEKYEYIEFLKSMILYSKENAVFMSLLDNINTDISLIEKNNVNAKGIVDSYLLKI